MEYSKTFLKSARHVASGGHSSRHVASGIRSRRGGAAAAEYTGEHRVLEAIAEDW